jgi:hypothetical protein
VATAVAHHAQSLETALHRKAQRAALTQVMLVAGWWAALAVWRALTTHGHHHARGG